jgi:MEDS: MEthanogen/methylotroph, DcmR Sensory domain
MSTQFPGVHSVEIYEEDGELIKSVGAIVATSLSLGDSALIVATPEHRAELARELTASGIPVDYCAQEGRYIALDAEEVMNSIMLDGYPDRNLFEKNFFSVLSSARERARNRNRGLTIYGECVALLWKEGRKEAALELERFWQDVFRDEPPFHLHCAYPRAVFADALEIQSVCDTHSHVCSG